MDVEGLLQSVIRLPNFMTSRLIVAGVVFYIASGFTPIGNASVGLLPDMDLINQVVEAAPVFGAGAGGRQRTVS